MRTQNVYYSCTVIDTKLLNGDNQYTFVAIAFYITANTQSRFKTKRKMPMAIVLFIPQQTLYNSNLRQNVLPETERNTVLQTIV